MITYDSEPEGDERVDDGNGVSLLLSILTELGRLVREMMEWVKGMKMRETMETMETMERETMKMRETMERMMAELRVKWWTRMQRVFHAVSLLRQSILLITLSHASLRVPVWKRRLKSISVCMPWTIPPALLVLWSVVWMRSEERRVGKECRSRWS